MPESQRSSCLARHGFVQFQLTDEGDQSPGNSADVTAAIRPADEVQILELDLGTQEEIKVNLPGFSAEAALGETTSGYRLTSGARRRSAGGSVIASRRSMSVKAGCGACSELKWPNGTGTGACVQDCCDLLGNCKIQACTCGGSGVAFGGGSFALRRF